MDGITREGKSMIASVQVITWQRVVGWALMILAIAFFFTAPGANS
jgi:hypothetical protein